MQKKNFRENSFHRKVIIQHAQCAFLHNVENVNILSDDICFKKFREINTLNSYM